MVSLSDVRNFKHRINPTEEIEGRGNFGYYVARPVSLYLTWLILQTPLRANQVTILHMILGIAGSCSLAHWDIGVRLVGCSLLYIGFIIDNVDGEIARFHKEVSITGKYVDTISHTIVNTFLYFAFSIGVYHDTNRFELVVLGFLAAIFSLRLDVLAMYTEAAKSVQQNLDKNYDYYGNVEGRLSTEGDIQLQFISKRAEKPTTRFLFAIFAYPGCLHVMTISLLIRYFVPGMVENLPLLVIYMYGLLLPVRRMLTIRRIIVTHETERQYLKLQNSGNNGAKKR